MLYLGCGLLRYVLIYNLEVSFPAKSINSWMACTKEMVFQQKRLEKAYFIFQMIGQAMIPLGQSFWKRPLNNPII